MITAYDYVHTRNDYHTDAMSEVAKELSAKYTSPLHIPELADIVSDDVLAPAAVAHDPAVIITEEHVGFALSALVPEASADDIRHACRPATIALVDWMRRNTQFRTIAYTGNGADFIVEP